MLEVRRHPYLRMRTQRCCWPQAVRPPRNPTMLERRLASSGSCFIAARLQATSRGYSDSIGRSMSATSLGVSALITTAPSSMAGSKHSSAMATAMSAYVSVPLPVREPPFSHSWVAITVSRNANASLHVSLDMAASLWNLKENHFETAQAIAVRSPGMAETGHGRSLADALSPQAPMLARKKRQSTSALSTSASSSHSLPLGAPSSSPSRPPMAHFAISPESNK
mmetsp:Transcript_46081/g.115417  ORF Transcript_46081/g.115417 Transcript_46081/m.115417 type:complete len:224 (-) Transcript_46081:305-976(-)